MKKVLSMLLILTLLLVGCGSEEAKEIEEPKDVEDVVEVDYSVWDDMKENIIGKSDKDIEEIISRKPSDIRNDSTRKWKKSTFSESVDLNEYLLSYVDMYMEDGDVHYIINFNYNTTTRVNYWTGLIYATVTEYERKEEHDAKTIGNGMLLGEYIIYPDGDIEEVGD